MLQTQLRQNRKLYIPMVYIYTLKVYTMLTNNESAVLRFLMVSLEQHSINEIAKECKLSPNGAYKILKKLEKLEIIKVENIANIKSYTLNFYNEITPTYLQLALVDVRIKLPKIKIRLEDFISFKGVCDAVVIFGSYLTSKEPRDLDVLFVFTRDKFKDYKQGVETIKNNIKQKKIIPYPIHDVILTPEDMATNIKTKNKVIQEIIRKGVVLWGQKTIAESVRNAHTKP